MELVNQKEIKDRKSSLVDIFRELHVPESDFEPRIEEYFKLSEKIFRKFSKQRKPSMDLEIEELSNIMGLWRINSILERWRQLKAEEDEIFSKRNKFVEILNSLLQKKTMDINESNELYFTTDSGKRLGPKTLSSGEKQLLILLGEALVQRGQKFIFIADEPELSLHVTWQENIIQALISLNAASQIIVATHSPDIIGPFSDRAVDMRDLVS